MSQSSSAQRPPLFNGEPFERIVAILISLVVIQAAVVGYLESHASIRSDEAKRAASHFAIEAMGARARGEIDYGFAYGDAYRRYEAYDIGSFIAFERGNDAASDRLLELRNAVTDFTPLLDEPYLDGDTFILDSGQYEVDSYFENVTLLQEQFLNAAAIDDAWSSKGQIYVAQLTVLAVSLFLSGISTTTGNRTRWLFVSVSVVLSLAMLVWMIVVAVTPVQSLSQTAMEAYARAQSLEYIENEEAAIEFYDVAIAESPQYSRAYAGRAGALYIIDELDASIADFETGIALGESSNGVLTDLFFAYYLNGNLEQAIGLGLQRTARDGVDALDFFDLGLIYFANGDTERAQQTYAAGLEQAASSVAQTRAAGEEVSSALWFFFDLATYDLDQLAYCMETGDCFNALPRELIQATDEDIPAMMDTVARMKSYAVALEYTGEPPGDLPDTAINDLAFADASGEQMTLFPPYTGEVQIDFDYTGFADGQLFVGKIYFDSNEDLSLRIVDEWSQGSDGTASYSLSFSDGGALVLSPGEYEVDLFVNGQLLANGGFVIESDGDPDAVALTEAEVSDDTVTYDLADAGLSLTTPIDWFEVVKDGDDLYYTSDPDEIQYIYVYVLEDAPPDPAEITAIVLEDFGMEGTDAGTAATVSGQEVVEFGLTYEDGGVWVGKAFAFYDDETGRGVVVSAEVLEGEASADDLYDMLLTWVMIPE